MDASYESAYNAASDSADVAAAAIASGESVSGSEADDDVASTMDGADSSASDGG